MGKNKKKGAATAVPYHGQRPHVQGKRPGPFLCFTVNLKNVIKRAFPSFNHRIKDSNKKCKSRIECLMDFLTFDINQLLIYENQKKRCKKPALIHQLRIMKMKVEEVKTVSCDNKCLSRAEEMLKRRSHLKCTSRSFRRELIEFMANVEQTDRQRKIVCEIMKQLDATDLDISGLCKSVKDAPKALACGIQTEADCGRKRKDCGDVQAACPEVCEEVMRPYEPSTDEDDHSIHLRYVPPLDSFKAHMARNPCALRLPLMCPPMKRIMNKMKASYLMDDVPCKLQADKPKAKPCRIPIVNCVKIFHGHAQQKRREENDHATVTDVALRQKSNSLSTSSDNFRTLMNNKGINVYSMKDISKIWLTTIKQIKEIYS